MQVRLSLCVRVHLQGLEGGAIAFVWVPWRRMKDQIEDRSFFATNCEDLSSI